MAPATGVVGVIPVFHIILLGESGRSGVADVVLAQEFLDLRRSLLVHQKPAPGLVAFRAARVPHCDGSWLPRKVGEVGEHRAGPGDKPRPLAVVLAALALAVREIFRHDPGVLVCRDGSIIRPQEADACRGRAPERRNPVRWPRPVPACPAVRCHWAPRRPGLPSGG